MFANLGSLGSLDLNSTFAQLTNLSLDSLQKNEEQTKTAEAVATNSNDNKKADQATMRHEHDEALIAELQKLLKQRDEEIRSLQSDLQRNEKEKCTTEAAQSDRTNQLEEELRRVIQSNGELKEQLGEAQRTVQQHQAQLTVSSSTTGKKNKKGKAVIAEEHMHTAPPSEAQDELVSSLRAQMAEMSQQLLGYQKQCGEHEQLARLYEEQRAAYASKCRVYEELSADKDQQSQLLAQREAKHVAIHKTWRDDLEALQKENQQLASQLQSAQQENGRLTSQTAEQAALAGKLQETQQKVTSLTEDCEALKQQLACEKDKGEALKAQLQQSTAQGENASSTLLSQLSAAQAMVEKKEKTAQELQDKLQGAADKLRELMQKYVDAKNKNAQLEQSLVELRKEQEKALGQKVK
ncbi:hypothetical protein EON64_03790 [archaeon]|nr:MAG: hypothetical protein EON64_03790 [archaeon]